MKSKPNDDWFIGKLLEETYQHVPNEESSKSPSDLFDYFKNHSSQPKISSRDYLLQSYFQSHGLVLAPLVYRNTSQCYRMQFDNLVFDFPSNWGIFKNLKSLASRDFVIVSKKEDSTSLASVLSEVVAYPADIVVITHSGEKFLALTRESSEEDRDWLTNFFGITETNLKKAA
jgi:hypothetical protein